jgi:hypothetical protein
MLHPETCGRDREFAMSREAAAVGDGEERDPVEIHFAKAGLLTKGQIGNHMSGFVRDEAERSTCQEGSNALPFQYTGRRLSFGWILRKSRSRNGPKQQKTQEY